jgi:DNA-binding IclR family transcriptional regulator
MNKTNGALLGDIFRAGGEGSKSEVSGIRVIARAADILKALGQHEDGLTLREIARQVSLPRSTVQRIVSALDDANLVIAASPTAGVRLGPALIALASSARQFDVAEIARPLLVQLRKDLGETVDFAVLGHDKAVVVDQVSGMHPLVAVSAVGSSLPLHASATGKALLAALNEDDLAGLRKRHRFTPYTKNSILGWEKLDADLAKIRKEGIAYDHEEYQVGVSAVAKVVYGPGGELGAISIVVPTERFDAIEETLAQTLLGRCETVQRRFGR